jgi:pimeloyl-ACP methyl ester carboxylesterase
MRCGQPAPADEESLETMMAAMRCRLGYLRCGAGVVPPVMADRIRSMLQLRGPFVELAEAGHHPMLDQPLPLVATLRTLLEFWSIT